jgi:hypothetical protein
MRKIDRFAKPQLPLFSNSQLTLNESFWMLTIICDKVLYPN